MRYGFLIAAALTFSAAGLAACSEKQPAEETTPAEEPSDEGAATDEDTTEPAEDPGDAVDATSEEVGEAIESDAAATGEPMDAMEDTGEAVMDAPAEESTEDASAEEPSN